MLTAVESLQKELAASAANLAAMTQRAKEVYIYILYIYTHTHTYTYCTDI
jgi:hypothetical protein